MGDNGTDSALTLEAAQQAENHGPQLNGLVWFLTAISVLFLGLRVYAKLWRGRRLWWDDYVLIAGWVSQSRSRILDICRFYECVRV